METIWTLILLLTGVPLFKISASHADNNATVTSHPGFDVTSWTKCAPSSEKFRGIQGVTLKQCVLRCGKRSMCQAINYRKKFQLCELFADGSLPLDGYAGDCVYVKRDDIKFQFSACSCSLGETCHSHTGNCSFQECTPFALPNGVIYGNMYNIGSRLMFTCDAGYQETNNISNTTCLSSGQWQYIPNCIGSGCGEPPAVENATVDPGTTTAESVRTYECIMGYTVFDPSSAMTTTCEEDTWTAPTFQCLKDCGLVNLTVGVAPDSGTYLTTEGTSLIVECNDGSTWTISCLGNGSWSYGNNICAEGCGEPPTAGNATVYDGKTVAGSVRMYACDTGYGVENPPQDMTTSCDGLTNLWTPVTFQCLIDCGTIDVNSGTLMVNDPYPTTDGSMHTVECDDGSSWFIVCLDNGTWWQQGVCYNFNMIGGECHSAVDCAAFTGVCINETCLCHPNFRWHSETGHCVKECDGLSGVFTDYENTRVSPRYVVHSSDSWWSCLETCHHDATCPGVVITTYTSCKIVSVTYDMLAEGDPDSFISISGSTFYSRHCTA